jgi:hypothetical protein
MRTPSLVPAITEKVRLVQGCLSHVRMPDDYLQLYLSLTELSINQFPRINQLA